MTRVTAQTIAGRNGRITQMLAAKKAADKQHG
jgi:hypothetical protein